MRDTHEFHTLLRKSGYRATPSRIAILEAFRSSKNPLSAQEIIEMLPATIDQATVYRNLKSLEGKGVIKQIDLRHNHAHYELADLKEHHHLICLRCGRIEDVHHCGALAVQDAVLKSSKHFSEIRSHSLEFYGLCTACSKKREAVPVAPHRTAPR